MASKLVPVIICTELRGVFFGYIPDGDEKKTELEVKGAKMAIYWGTTGGVAQLAATGPTSTSRIGSKADVTLQKVSAVFTVTAEAEKAWAKV